MQNLEKLLPQFQQTIESNHTSSTATSQNNSNTQPPAVQATNACPPTQYMGNNVVQPVTITSISTSSESVTNSHQMNRIIACDQSQVTTGSWLSTVPSIPHDYYAAADLRFNGAAAAAHTIMSMGGTSQRLIGSGYQFPNAPVSTGVAPYNPLAMGSDHSYVTSRANGFMDQRITDHRETTTMSNC